MVSRYTSLHAKQKQAGFSATHHQDFIAHVNGDDFKHFANQINVTPITNLAGTDVQAVLESLESSINSQGTGFISIGIADGYEDGYTPGVYNVGAISTPTFESALTAAFTDQRLTKGGVILILAGQYNMTSTVSVPPGIMLMGEAGGTIINGVMSETAMFRILPTTVSRDIGGDSGTGVTPLLSGSNQDKVIFHNLILADNLDASNSGITSTSMIEVSAGANFEADKVSFWGKLNAGTVLNRLKTKAAISTINTSSNGTIINLNNCFIDGVAIAIIMSTAIAAKDYLTVYNSRIRWFGAEGNSYDITKDSCIYSSFCNISILNCYLIGGGNNTGNVLGYTNTGGDTSLVRLLISGNSGTSGLFGGTLVDTNSSITSIQANITGNNWGTNIDSSWYVVVGGSDTSSRYGDFNGPNALDLVLDYARQNYLRTTVFINSGTYTLNGSVTSSHNFSNLQFIGVKEGVNYPVIQLDISATETDQLGNRFVVLGNHLESLYFISIGTTRNSIRPAFHSSSTTAQQVANTLVIKDCIFTDTTLNLQALGSSSFVDTLGEFTTAVINIEECYFHKTGSYTANLDLSCPIVNLLNIKDCFFFSTDWAISVGIGYGSDYAVSRPVINLENVYCDLTGSSVSANNPSGSNNHVNINSSSATVNIKNCEFLATNILDNSASLVHFTAGVPDIDYRACYSITASNINIKNSTFNGTSQFFVDTGVDYPVIGCSLQPSLSCKLENNIFIGGALPLQISSALSSNSIKNTVILNNNHFDSGATSLATQLSQTLLDVDIDCTSSSSTTMSVINNTFKCTPASNPLQPKHTYVTGSTYDTNAAVQLYCKGLNTRISGNHITTLIKTPTVNPFNHFAALAVNTFNSDSGSSSVVTTSSIDNNYISIKSNTYTSGNFNDSVAALKVLTTVGNITSNFLNCKNGTAGSNVAGCLDIDTRLVGSVGSAVVSHNTFGRADDNGVQSSLNRAYVYVPSTSDTSGFLTQNFFDSTTIDGSATTLFEDNSSLANRWVFQNNKNQTESLLVYGNIGTFGIGDPTIANTDYYITGTGYATDSAISFNYKMPDGYTGKFYYNTTDEGTDLQFVWSLPIFGIVPEGAFIVSASLPVIINSNVTGVGSKSIATLTGLKTAAATSFTNSINPLTSSGGTLTFGSGTHGGLLSSPVLGTTIEFTWRVLSDLARHVSFGPLTITYRW